MKSTQKPNIKDLLESYNIENISMHTDNIDQGAAFCVTKYVKEYVDMAISKGAKFIVSEEELPDLPENVSNIIVPNIKEFITDACLILYPEKPKYMVGVTGTSGKTSIVDYFRQICTHMGLKTASFGTMGIICSDKNIEKRVRAKYTNNINTPDPTTFHKILNFLAKEGVEYVAFEVSSHGLHQDRIEGVKLDVAVFSNLSQDHLDYHKTMEAYMRAKLRIFTKYLAQDGVAITSDKLMEEPEVRKALESKNPVILREAQRADRQDLVTGDEDPPSSRGSVNDRRDLVTGDEEVNNSSSPVTRSLRSSKLSLWMTDVVITSLTTNTTSQDLHFTYAGEEFKATLNMMGSFQSSNALMAFAAVMACGVDPSDAAQTLSKLVPVAGRLQNVTESHHPFQILVDYAHKPEALESCLKELKSICTGRLFLLFGCGGDRDSSKRSIMGAIATKYADIVIVTDDNPRTEDPSSIRKDVMDGAKDAIEIPDRADAIKKAVAMLEKGDILLLAGKGHEDYQIIGTKKIHFDDSEEVRKNL